MLLSPRVACQAILPISRKEMKMLFRDLQPTDFFYTFEGIEVEELEVIEITAFPCLDDFDVDLNPVGLGLATDLSILIPVQSQ